MPTISQSRTRAKTKTSQKPSTTNSTTISEYSSHPTRSRGPGDVRSGDARYVLVLSTAAYVRKHWTRVEYGAAREGKEGRLLLVDLGVQPADYPDDEIYIRGTPNELVRLVSVIKARISEPQRPRCIKFLT